jgi:membrane associated rhomboid family serine protease
MREPALWRPWPLTIWLVIANAAAFVLQMLADDVFPPASRFSVSPVDQFFALSLGGLQRGFIWQLVTFQFMHGGWLHLFLNCWAIYVFGRVVEAALGRRVFLLLYLGSGVLGGLLQMLGAWAVPKQFGGEVVGASAGAFGLVATFAVLHPEHPLTVLLFFLIPIRLRAKSLLFVCGVLAALGLVSPGLANLMFMGNVAHAAHLAGMLTGIAGVRWVTAPHRLRPRPNLEERNRDLKNRAPVVTLQEP